MATLNGKPILASGTGLFKSGDTLEVSTAPVLSFQEGQGAGPALNFAAKGHGFGIDVVGFTPAATMVGMYDVRLVGKLASVYVVVTRVASAAGQSLYSVEYSIAEA